VVDRGELEAALREPQKYPHLLVRLGGWSARFVELERYRMYFDPRHRRVLW